MLHAQPNRRLFIATMRLAFLNAQPFEIAILSTLFENALLLVNAHAYPKALGLILPVAVQLLTEIVPLLAFLSVAIA